MGSSLLYSGILNIAALEKKENSTLSLESSYMVLLFFFQNIRDKYLFAICFPPLKYTLSKNRDFVYCYKSFTPKTVSRLKEWLNLHFEVINTVIVREQKQKQKIYHVVYEVKCKCHYSNSIQEAIKMCTF